MKRLPEATLAVLDGPGASGLARPQDRLAHVLDSVIPDPELYDDGLARRLPAPRAHEALRDARERIGPLLAPADLEQFNRVLLEDAYRGTLKSIYQARLEAVISDMHTQPRAALCLSGGGIRSGTFSLGILQGLARGKLLRHFHYLSTVSGGGYIGGWLTTWCHRHRDGFRGVEKDLAESEPAPKLEPEPPPLRHLREFSNFVAPRVSIISADIWSFAAIYIRNLLINWSVLIPLLLAFVLFPRLLLTGLYVTPWALRIVLCLALGLLLSLVAVLYITLNRPSRADALASRPFLSKRRTQRAVLTYALVPTVFAGMFLSLFWGWIRLRHPGQDTSFLSPVQVFDVTLPFPFYFGLGLILLGSGLYALALIFACLVLRRRPRFSDLLAVAITGTVGGLLTWLLLHVVFPHPVAPRETGLSLEPALYVSLAVPAYLLVFFVSAGAFVAATSRRTTARSLQWFAIEDEDREWLGRHGAWLLIAAIGWLVFSALVLFGPFLLVDLPRLLSGIGGIAGLVALIGGRSARTPASGEATPKRGWKDILVEHSLSIAAVLFIAVLVVALSWFSSWLLGWIVSTSFEEARPNPVFLSSLGQEARGVWDPKSQLWMVRDLWDAGTRNGQLAILHFVPLEIALVLAAGLGVVAWMLGRVVNLNRFSLHAAYRARIIRAFLGASRPDDDREPNPFTGFDPQDNVQMHELRPGLISETSFKPDGLAWFVKRLREAQTAPTDALKTSYVAARHAGQAISNGLVRTVPYAAVYQRLSKTTRKLLANHEGLNPPSQSLKRELIEDLNRLIEGDLFRIELFRDLPASDRIAGLLPKLGAPALPSPRPSNVDVVDRLPGHDRGQAAIVVRRAILDDAFDELEALRTPPPPWATYRLMHVVGTALNLVGGKRLAWQQRRAESFTISPLHCGSPFTGYRPARDYGGPDGVSLGTAVTISGAAVSSNMGYHSSSAAVTFVLTLFNARLGWWLGNSGPAGTHAYKHSSPRSSITPLRLEAFGLTDDTSEYVLLSDGGHFDNLGLYEMVLRRCRFILAVDGGQDAAAAFDDLGGAIRKIRIDLGIDIEFPDPIRIYPRRANLHEAPPPNQTDGAYCAIGRIKYSDVDTVRPDDIAAPDGVLLYVKPAIYGREPRDVLNYASANPDFPHQSTADQLFDEAQFESYRRLGLWVMNRLAGAGENESDTPKSLGDFLAAVRTYMENDASQEERADKGWLDATQTRFAATPSV